MNIVSRLYCGQGIKVDVWFSGRILWSFWCVNTNDTSVASCCSRSPRSGKIRSAPHFPGATMATTWIREPHQQFEKRAIDEMNYAEKLIGHILSREGRPTVSNLANIQIGADVSERLAKDNAVETDAIKTYDVVYRLRYIPKSYYTGKTD